MGYKMITMNGYCYYAAMSAFQKSIRRCNEPQTVFWGIELYDSNFEAHVWNRLLIIAHEDIGLAEPGFTQKTLAYKEAHDYLKLKRPKKVSKKLVFLQCLIEFARAKKSRYTDLAYSVYWSKHQERAETMQIPDYAYDMHTVKGKTMKRGLKHFYESSALINNANKLSGEEEFEKLAMIIDEEESTKPKVKIKEKVQENKTPPKLF